MPSQSHPNNKTESIEDVGYGYFRDLHSREFFEAIEKDDENKRVTKCRVPNHDVAMSAARRRCFHVSREEENIDPGSLHLSFGFHLGAPWQVPDSLDQAKRIRTILLPCQLARETEGRPGKSICGLIVSSCKGLRVLDLHNCGITTVSDSIHELKYLRYLDLSHNMNIRTLPNSITKLHELQTLKLNFCARLQRLPRDTRKLVNLRHLEIEGCYSLIDMPELHKLANLRTLSDFVLSKDSGPNPSIRESESANMIRTKRSCGLKELMNLNNLHGRLLIKNLKPGENYGDANLKEKPLLRSLVLIWDVAAVNVADCRQGTECSSNEKTTADDYFLSLDGLEPHVDIKDLSLSAYGDARFPDWFVSLKNLVTVSLWRCMNCQYLPPLDQIYGLKILVLGQLTSLEYIADKVNYTNSSSSVAVLSSLKELQLIELPKLKGWWREKVEGEEDHHGSCSTTTTNTTSRTAEIQAPSFSKLSKLVIENCPELISMPLFPCLDELLEWNNSSWKPFQQTMMSIHEKIQKTISSTAAFTSSAAPIPPWLLSTLRCLHIVGIKEADMRDGDAIMWSLFKQNLGSLTFDHLPQLKALPVGLANLGRLQELHISRCNNLEVIPGWIRDLKSLEKVSLRLLPSLTSLPEGMNSHTSSIKLEIEDCPRIARNLYPIQDLVEKYLSATREDYQKPNAEEVVLNASSYTFMKRKKNGSSYTWKEFEKEVRRSSNIGDPEFQSQVVQSSDENSLKKQDASSNPIASRVFNLRIDGIRELPSLPEWLKGLTCLKKLSIWNCPNLKYLSPGIHHFNSLQELEIYKCEELDMLNDNAAMWQELQRRLRHITFQELPKLVDLPQGLGHLTALQKLHVFGCTSLMTIPEEISNLKSLKEIIISRCPNLRSLPEGISSLGSLRKLEIRECPVLLNRCQRGRGEDWHKIAHVPKKYLGYRR